MTNQHRNSFTMCTLTALATLPFIAINDASAHGYSTYPEARQLVCATEGNIWSGTPPMLGCETAKDISGTYPFVQINEFSINIPDYYNQATVEAAVPDGTLCHANDPRKVGMSAVNDPSAWTRTELNAGTFTYTFNATAPHNPSFWKFYVTKQGTDLSQPLKWSDLDLIKEDNDSVVGSVYTTDLTIPDDRSGDHILFVRWQRIDEVGEGFYNCSDITVVNEDIDDPNNDEDPEPVLPYLVQGEQYILPEYQIGDRLTLEVLTESGNVHNTFVIDVTGTNFDFIPELLAADVSGYYTAFHDSSLFIGAWHAEMNHYMYFQNGNANYLNSRNGDYSYSVSVDEISIAPTSLHLKELLESDRVIEYGDYAHLSINGSYNSFYAEELSAAGVELTFGNDYVLIGTNVISESLLPIEVTLKVTMNPVDITQQEQSITFTVVDSSNDDTISPPISDSIWDETVTYNGGDLVSFNGQIWEAQWWVIGGEDPETNYAADAWGVWRPSIP